MSENLLSAAAGKSASRRTVLKAAAWAAPVVAVAAAAPLAAASTTPPPQVDGANIAASNFGAERGAVINLVDQDFNPIPYPAGTTIELTVTGTGSLQVSRVANGAFSPEVTTLTAGTYTLNPNGGAMNVNFRGSLTGTLTVEAAITYPDGNGNFPTIRTSQAVISA